MKTFPEDEMLIRTALENYYFKGLCHGDIKALEQIFNPGTLLYGDINGLPYAKTLQEYLHGVGSRQSPKDSGKPFEPKILSVKVINSIAIAEVKLKIYDFYYHDMLSFHRIGGKWKIVNKLLTDTNI